VCCRLPRVIFLDTPTNHIGNPMRSLLADSARGSGQIASNTTVPAWIADVSLLRTPPAHMYGA
jgi:hypothetical protein